MTSRDESRIDSYAQVYQIGDDKVSVDYYAVEPKPGPHWIFTVERKGIKRVYKYTLRPQHILERRAARTPEAIAVFLHHHIRSAEPVKTLKRDDDESEGTAHKR